MASGQFSARDVCHKVNLRVTRGKLKISTRMVTKDGGMTQERTETNILLHLSCTVCNCTCLDGISFTVHVLSGKPNSTHDSAEGQEDGEQCQHMHICMHTTCRLLVCIPQSHIKTVHPSFTSAHHTWTQPQYLLQVYICPDFASFTILDLPSVFAASDHIRLLLSRSIFDHLQEVTAAPN